MAFSDCLAAYTPTNMLHVPPAAAETCNMLVCLQQLLTYNSPKKGRAVLPHCGLNTARPLRALAVLEFDISNSGYSVIPYTGLAHPAGTPQRRV